MSILPSHAHQGSASSSSPSAPENPNLSHGVFTVEEQHLPDPEQRQRQQQQQLSLSSAESPDLDSLRISEPNSAPGEMAEASPGPSGSSGKVTRYGSSNRKKSPSQSGSIGAQSNLVPQGRVASSQSSGEVSSSPPNRRATGSVGRRSQTVNGNYLLNFQFNPIARSQPRAPPPRTSKKAQKIKPYNKDLFLQANYKFVVLDSGSYTLDSMDPDKMLQWEDIICVKYSTPHPVHCPICLDVPLCPQITSCGHIFCFPCILQYLLLGEENHKAECWRKCPLCFMMISTKDLYTIYIENLKEHNVGDALEFSLLTRKKDSFSLHEKHEEAASTKARDSFSKFILTSDVDLSVREAMSDLDKWLVRADSGLVDDLEKLPYVCAAVEQLEQRKKHWSVRRGAECNGSSKIVVCNSVVVDVKSKPDAFELEPQVSSPGTHGTSEGVNNVMVDSVHFGASSVPSSDTDDSLESHDGALSSSYGESKALQFQSDISREPKERDSYSFYQAVDGQHIILHPLNMKCLLHHYGSYDLLPPRVSGRILQLESVTQSDDMRRRYRYLSHFPLTTTFQLCEIDLKEVLPPDGMSPFVDEIKKREKQRKWLAKKEREDKLKADAIAAYAEPMPYHIVQSSYDAQPAFSMDDFEALGSSAPVVSNPPVQGGRLLFSNVARLGFAAAHDSPTLSIPETSPLPNAQGTTHSAGGSGSGNQAACSFANVISRDRSAENLDSRKASEASGKKGKKQSRVLLSTAGGRRY